MHPRVKFDVDTVAGTAAVDIFFLLHYNKIYTRYMLCFYCCASRKDGAKIQTSSESLAESGFSVDRWMSRGRVAKVRMRETTLVCRMSTETLAKSERDILHALAGCVHIPLLVRVRALPTCVFYKYVPGIDLHQAVSANMLSKSTLQGYFRSIATALAFCHDRGIAHLDVKPENIVLRHNKVPVLIDWEHALRVSNEFELRDVDPKRGTVQYMAPEMLNCSRGGCPSDVWSFAKAYTVCTGTALFVAENPEHRSTIKSLEIS